MPKADPIVAAHRKGNQRSGTYLTWDAMRHRTQNENHRSYHQYGGRGIKMDPAWAKSFAAFVTDMGERPEGMTIDRIDPDGDYVKSNCRWATAKTQRANQRSAK